MGNYDNYDLLRCEFFEYLFPGLVYGGTQEEQLQLIETLEEDGSGLIHYLFEKLCKEDGVEYPYTDNDFKVNLIERGGIHYIQICVPGYNPEINDVLQAYILYTNDRETDAIVEWRYFLIKRFWDGGKVSILHITADDEKLLGDDLTDKENDLEYEYWKLARNYMSVIAENIKEWISKKN